MRSIVSIANGGRPQRLVCAAGVWLNQRHQLAPRNHQIHLVEDLLASLLGQRIKAEGHVSCPPSSLILSLNRPGFQGG
jgi:hypothetical protein